MLIVAAAWGYLQYKRRSREEKAITEAATHELYEHPDRYREETHDKLEEAAEKEQQRQEQNA